MEAIKIILLSVVAAVTFGILHDQVTARICVEYFTIGHVPMFDTESPTLLAIGWGTIATWWVGVLLGVPAAGLARIGRMPKLSAARLIRPIGYLMLAAACASLTAGMAGYLAARAGWVWLVGEMAIRVPAEKHTAFVTDLWAHTAAYGASAVGGVILWGWIWWQRVRLMRQARVGAS